MRAIVPASGLAEIIDRFEGLIIGQECIINDHEAPHPGALDTLEHLKSAGTRIVIVATSAQSDKVNVERLSRVGVSPEYYERLLSTGHLMQQALIAKSLDEMDKDRRYFLAASPDEKALFDQGRLVRTDDLKDANAIIVLSLEDAQIEDPARIAWLGEAAGRGMPLYTPKADVRTLAPRGAFTPGFAAMLNLYLSQGGEVILFGKPSGRVYARCLNILDPIETNRVAAIGDQFPSDILGPRSMDIEPILVGTGAGGLKGKSASEIEDWHAELVRLCDPYAVSDLIVMPGLIW